MDHCWQQIVVVDDAVDVEYFPPVIQPIWMQKPGLEEIVPDHQMGYLLAVETVEIVVDAGGMLLKMSGGIYIKRI